jgi:hypothetical protein
MKPKEYTQGKLARERFERTMRALFRSPKTVKIPAKQPVVFRISAILVKFPPLTQSNFG